MAELPAILTTPPADAWKLDYPGRMRMRYTSIVIDIDFSSAAAFKLGWVDHEYNLIRPRGSDSATLMGAKEKALHLFKVLELMGFTP